MSNTTIQCKILHHARCKHEASFNDASLRQCLALSLACYSKVSFYTMSKETLLWITDWLFYFINAHNAIKMTYCGNMYPAPPLSSFYINVLPSLSTIEREGYLILKQDIGFSCWMIYRYDEGLKLTCINPFFQYIDDNTTRLKWNDSDYFPYFCSWIRYVGITHYYQLTCASFKWFNRGEMEKGT